MDLHEYQLVLAAICCLAYQVLSLLLPLKIHCHKQCSVTMLNIYSAHTPSISHYINVMSLTVLYVCTQIQRLTQEAPYYVVYLPCKPL